MSGPRVDLTGVAPSPVGSVLESDPRLLRAAHTGMPLHLTGEEGIDLPFFAATIHEVAFSLDRPFVRVASGVLPNDPRRAQDQLRRLIEGASGGTLYLEGLETLDVLAHPFVGVLLDSFAGHWASSSHWADDQTIRLIASSNRELRELEFNGPLWDDFAAASFHVPPLSERPAQAEALIDRICSRCDDDDPIDPELRSFLIGYEWKGHERELARVVGRLLIERTNGRAGLPDLERIEPKLVRPQSKERARRQPKLGTSPKIEPINRDSTPIGRQVLDRTFDPGCHPSLFAALEWLSDNYADDISTADAADAAEVSTSHLSHLIKTWTGEGFRLLLARVRVERAKQLLALDPERRITDIALDVGFGDLSHFIKSFNRFVGMSPRDYRRRHVHSDISGADYDD